MEKLLAIVSIGQNIYGKWLFRRLLLGMIVVTGLTIVTAMIIGTTLIGGLYATYLALLHFGYDPHSAVLIVVVLSVAIAGTLIILTLMFFSHLRSMPRKLMKTKSPALSEASEVVNAFLEGLIGSAPRT